MLLYVALYHLTFIFYLLAFFPDVMFLRVKCSFLLWPWSSPALLVTVYAEWTLIITLKAWHLTFQSCFLYADLCVHLSMVFPLCVSSVTQVQRLVWPLLAFCRDSSLSCPDTMQETSYHPPRLPLLLYVACVTHSPSGAFFSSSYHDVFPGHCNHLSWALILLGSYSKSSRANPNIPLSLRSCPRFWARF